MGLSISITETETMCIVLDAEFFIDGEKLKNIKRFKCLDSYVLEDCSMEEELTARNQQFPVHMEDWAVEFLTRMNSPHPPKSKFTISVLCLNY